MGRLKFVAMPGGTLMGSPLGPRKAIPSPNAQSVGPPCSDRVVK